MSGRGEAPSPRSPTADLGWSAAFGLDQHQRILSWSEAAETHLGIPADRAIGRPCYEVLEGLDFFGRPYCRKWCPAFISLLNGHLQSHCALEARPTGQETHRLRWKLLALPPGSGPRVVAYFGQGRAELVQLAHLSYMSSALSTPIQLDALRGILGWVAESTEMEVAELFLLDEQTRHMVLTAQHGPFSAAFRQITEFSPPEGYPGLIAATAEPILTEDLPQDSRYLRSKVKEAGFREYACVPLLRPEGVLGSLSVAARGGRHDLGSVVEQLRSLSKPLSSAISSTILQARDSVAEFQAEPTWDMQRNLELLLKQVLSKMVALSGACGGTLTLRDPATGGVTCRVMEGEEKAVPLCPLVPGSPTICPAWAEHRNVLLAGYRRRWPEGCRALSPEEGVVVCVPLMADGDALGVVSLRHRTSPASSPTQYLGVLAAVAHRAALLVRNVQIYGRARAVAVEADRQRLLEGIQKAVPHQSRRYAERGEESASPVNGGEQGFLDIRCFGDFCVYRNGQLLPPQAFARRQALTVLKVLHVNLGRKVPKELLIEALWPGLEPEKGAERLHVVIHALRRALEPGSRGGGRFVLSDGDHYYWNTQAPCRIDIEDFRSGIRKGEELERQGQLATALAVYQAAAQLYRGDFMQDEPYSDWCWTDREFFREVYLGLVRRVARLLEGQGDLESAILYYRQALQADPLREDTQREFMASLWRAGHRDQALRQYTAFSQRLEKELGVQPLPETEELYQRMKALDADP